MRMREYEERHPSAEDKSILLTVLKRIRTIATKTSLIKYVSIDRCALFFCLRMSRKIKLWPHDIS